MQPPVVNFPRWVVDDLPRFLYTEQEPYRKGMHPICFRKRFESTANRQGSRRRNLPPLRSRAASGHPISCGMPARWMGCGSPNRKRMPGGKPPGIRLLRLPEAPCHFALLQNMPLRFSEEGALCGACRERQLAIQRIQGEAVGVAWVLHSGENRRQAPAGRWRVRRVVCLPESLTVPCPLRGCSR